MSAEDVIISLSGMTMVILLVLIVAYLFIQRQKIRAGAGTDYQRLAEEAVRTQRILLDETRRLNETLKEIERLLREV